MDRRIFRTLASLLLTVGVTTVASAQISLQPTPAPTITAEMSSWYQSREPITFNGMRFYPSGPQVYFNGNEMVLSGYYRGVPLYSRTTLETNSFVFAPLPGGLMQPYERRRSGELAGTVGSSAPSFPVDRDVDTTGSDYSWLPQAPGPPTNIAPYYYPPIDSASRPPYRPRPLATLGVEPEVSADTQPRPVIRRKPTGPNGVYVVYSGMKWFSSGTPQRFDETRFVAVGSYDGRPVYTERQGGNRTIYVPIPESSGFLLAPYTQR